MSKKIIKSAQNDRYVITLIEEKEGNSSVYVIYIKSLLGSGHNARHTTYNKISDFGAEVKSERISLNIADLLIDNIMKKGETEGFNLLDGDLQILDVSDIRHKLTLKEKSFTSRGEKLFYHWPIFKKYKETGFGSIIRATLTLHQVCSSHCPYCSTIARNNKDSISLQEAKDFVEKLYFGQAQYNREYFGKYNELYKQSTGTDIRLRGLILSGGGQPNLWPHFAEFVDWLAALDIELGLITNGFPRNIDPKVYKNFTWIRLSITPEDASPHYINNQFNQQYIPEDIVNNSKITFGLSYVYGSWTTDDILSRIEKAINVWNADYCRILTDCNLTRNSQLIAHQELSNRLFKLGLIDEEGSPRSKIFHQLKYHGTKEEAYSLWEEGQCFLQIYNVFWDTTGHDDKKVSYCYTCDSITVLAEENNAGINVSERRFNAEKWGTVTNNNVSDLFTKPVKAYFDPRQVCKSCLFMNNNKVVKELIAYENYNELKKQFDIQHINFP